MKKVTLVYHSTERDTNYLGPFLTGPHPQPHPHCARSSSCPGRAPSGEEGSTFSGHFLFFVWGYAKRVSWTGAGDRERKKGNSHQLPGKTLSWKYYSPLWILLKFGTVWGREAVILCLPSPGHHSTHVLKWTSERHLMTQHVVVRCCASHTECPKEFSARATSPPQMNGAAAVVSAVRCWGRV